VQDVIGNEQLQPEKATLLGPCLVIPQEYPHLSCRSVDIQLPQPHAPDGQQLLERLVTELLNDVADTAVAYRGRRRWVQTFTPLSLPKQPIQLRANGHYLITGGLGRIGLTLAAHLAETKQARLTLVDQFNLPPQAEWANWLTAHAADDPTSRKIRQVQTITALGSDILIRQVDVTDESRMRALVDECEGRFGPLHGIIHAAGLIGDAAIKTIAETQAADCARQFQAKVQGTMVLERVLHDRPLDFCLLQSSLASVLGGLGFAAYAAANRFMDALALRHNQSSPVPWLSINWDGWQFNDEAETAAATGITALAISPEEGTAVFQKLPGLASLGQVILSTGDLHGRIAKWLTRETAVSAPETESADRFPRPHLQTDFAAPRSPLEESIVGMWQTVLGLEQVGIWDDFFELGGHSLLATQLISRLRDLYKVELPLRDLFENPTAAGLAKLIAAAQAKTATKTSSGITPIARDGDLPLSSGQQRLWFLDQLEPGSPLYNNFAAIRLSGTVNVAALGQCLNEIVRRHEILRTTFTEVNGRPRQIIAPELTLPLPVEDLQSIPITEQEQAVMEKAMAAATRPFDLTEGPLLRLQLLQLAPDEHVILITMHHIISDGWSVGVLIQETAALYTAFANGAASPLLPLSIQYADYAAWQQAWLQDETVEDGVAAQLDYWRQQLANPPILELPTDRLRPAVQTANGANEWFNLPPELYKKLETLGQEIGATLFMTLTAVLQTLLHRYTGQEDICIGAPIANRNRSETENLIGFLLNTLVLRTDLSGSPTFRELLDRVRTVTLAAYDHQDLPFELLVETLQPERDMSRSPLFQVMFDLQEAPLPRLNLPGLAFSPLRVDGGTAKFDLALSMQVGQDGLTGYLNYNTDLFDADTISRMLTHFQMLLESVCANPDQPIATLPLLSEAEQTKLLTEWNHTAVSPHPFQSIPHRIEAQAAKTPDAIALVLDDAQLTYAEFNQRTNQLAHHLQQCGVGPDTVVGLLTARSMEAIIGLVAILKAGGIYLPLDPADPAERLASKIEDAQPAVILTIDDLRLTIDDALKAPTNRKSKIVNLKSAWPTIAQHPTTNLPISHSPDATAYIIYTSGSTGKPKGVCISHEAIAAHIADIQAHFELQPADRVLQFAAYSFDQSIEQILATLVSGAALVLRGPDIWPTADFSAVIETFGLTVINLPPAYWRQWVQDVVAAETAVPHPQLRLVIIGGDVLPAAAIRQWQQTPMASARLLNAYGPTETTITALTYDVPTPFERSQTPIGRPGANRAIYILDRQMQPVPIGVPGELYIGGAGVAQGYLNRPELTVERFIPLPVIGNQFSVIGKRLSENGKPITGHRSPITDHRSPVTVYRTGDLCRFLPDGSVEFLGRVDSQVKIRGFRIELGEIEAALHGYEGVRETAVITREDEPGEKQLVAYLVPDDGEPPKGSELRQFLSGKLPDYMIPTAFVTLDELPLTVSGKINHRALPAPQTDRSDLNKAYTAPRTPVEAELAQMWADLLKVEPVGIHDNFFELGGHSLLGAQLISRVRADFQVDFPLRRLFETPTVAGLASLIVEGLAAETDESELEALLAELEDLTDDEAHGLLTKL
jgi:amino acid adenylation domain-containing protein